MLGGVVGRGVCVRFGGRVVGRGRGRGGSDASALTPEAVLDAALALIDEVGVAGFTMRALAGRLNTYPATLYWHVGNRNEILAGVLQLVMDDMTVPAADALSWDDWLGAAAREYRWALHRHPNAAVLAMYPLLTSRGFAESLLSVLVRGGFRGPALAHAFNAFTGSVCGWVAVELSAAAGEPDQVWQAEFETRVRALSAEQFPTIVSNLDHLADEAFTLRWHGGHERPLDDSFDVALEVWLAGLRAFRRSSRR